MKISFGADMHNHVTEHIVEGLRAQGHEVQVHRQPSGAPMQWPDVGAAVARAVASGQVDEGIVCCWTGTGVSIAANKISGVRAALCGDAETARGARRYDDANVLCLGLRTTTEAIADEVIGAWLDQRAVDDDQVDNIAKIAVLEARPEA